MGDYFLCPYCGYSDDICNFPDYFEDGEKVKDLLSEHGVNIVTCGMCGKAIVQEDWEEKA